MPALPPDRPRPLPLASPAASHLQAWGSAAALLLACLVAFTLCRIDFLVRFTDTAWQTQPATLAQALAVGLKFDLKLVAQVLLVMLLATWLTRAAPAHWQGALRRGAGRLRWLLFIAFALLSVAQVGYFDFYKTPFNPIVFGFFEDDTVAVLQSIWSDYPVVKMLACVVGLSLLQHLLYRRLLRAWTPLIAVQANRPAWPRAVRVAITLVGLATLAVAARGSLGTFPLRSQNAVISDNQAINGAVMNAPFALFVAWRDRQGQVAITAASMAARLEQLGFKDIDAVKAVLAPMRAPDAAPTAPFDQRQASLKPAGFRAPHVVLAVMESWSEYLLHFDHPQRNDLLGALRPHLDAGAHLSRMVSAELGTHSALEHLLINSPISPLTQGRLGQITFDGAAARPFQQAGYHTVFVYGGSGAWRRIGEAMKHQGFDTVLDMGAILDRFPEAPKVAWGVHDEYLFKLVAEQLAQADAAGERLLVVLMTISNHPPHDDLPANDRHPTFDYGAFGREAALPEAQGLPLLQTYRYANDQLGRFLDTLQRSDLEGRTIVAATGDHNIRTFFRYKLPDDLLKMVAVPLYLRIPPAYLPPDRDADWTQQWAGHQDVFPTLYELALSGTTYPRFGRNLLEPVATAPAEPFAQVNGERAFGAFGAVNLADGDAACFTWPINAPTQGRVLTQPLLASPCSARHEAARQFVRANVAWQDQLIRRQALQLPRP